MHCVNQNSHVKNGRADGTRDRVASVGVEVQRFAEYLRDVRPSDDGAEGEAIADALGHHHDVGLDAVALEAPEVLSCARESRLHFVGDAQSAQATDV